MEGTCALRSVGVCFWHAQTLNDLKKICACYYYYFFFVPPRCAFLKTTNFSDGQERWQRRPHGGGRRKRENLTVRRVRSGGCWC